MRLLLTATFIAAATLSSLNVAASTSNNTEITINTRYFSEASQSQKSTDTAIQLTHTIDQKTDNGYWQFSPFVQYSSHDDTRRHVDIRELFLNGYKDSLEWKIGISREYWGVVESRRLVDIINQRDLSTDFDGETVLGQPLLSISAQTDIGLFEQFILPCYRPLNLGNKKSRLNFTPYSFEQPNDLSCHSTSQIFDWATRWSHSFNDTDIALSHFNGTQRMPDIIIGQDNNPALIYRNIRQTSLELLSIIDSWIFKLEATNRSTSIDSSAASVGGFEYTLPNIIGNKEDLGLLLEYQYDQANNSANDNDAFLGFRWVENDIEGTELLFGILMDTKDNSSRSISIEYKSRLTNDLSLTASGHLFSSGDASNPVSLLKNEDHLSISLSYYF